MDHYQSGERFWCRRRQWRAAFERSAVFHICVSVGGVGPHLHLHLHWPRVPKPFYLPLFNPTMLSILCLVHIYKIYKTHDNGSLGSRDDEERSQLRKRLVNCRNVYNVNHPLFERTLHLGVFCACTVPGVLGLVPMSPEYACLSVGFNRACFLSAVSARVQMRAVAAGGGEWACVGAVFRHPRAAWAWISLRLRPACNAWALCLCAACVVPWQV